MAIDKFTGKYAVLSPDYPIEFICQEADTIYPTIQHAFEACKTDAPCKKRYLSELSVKKAMAATKKWRRWPDWEHEKEFCMEGLIREKFTEVPNADEYAEVLLSTGKEELIFTGPLADKYWGVVGGQGENRLGKILMLIREELKGE